MTNNCDGCPVGTLDCIKCIEINGKPWCEISNQENMIEASKGRKK